MKSLEGNDYTLLSSYVNAKEKMDVLHNSCGHHYSVNWNNFKSGKRCPRCSGRMTDEEFTNKVKDLVGEEYTFMEKYTISKNKIRIRHNNTECRHEYEVTPNHFFKGRRCPKCWFDSRKKTHGTFVKEVYDLTDGEYLVLGEYYTARKKIDVKHKSCGNTYEVVPNDFLQGNRCPSCNRSKGEDKISKFLIREGVKFLEEVSFEDFVGDKNVPYRYDFCLEGTNDTIYLIEYDGEQHFKSVPYYGGDKGLESRKKNDSIKNWYAYDNQIELLRIRYDEIKIAETVVDDFLKKNRIN